MLRSVAPYHAVALILAAAGGAAYGAGAIGVPALYLVVLVAGVVAMVGYVRWDLRHYG
jgi:hypothetical protein